LGDFFISSSGHPACDIEQDKQEPILRLRNLQLQSQRCSRLGRFLKVEENFFSNTRKATRGVVIFLQRKLIAWRVFKLKRIFI
jgi:hypothetical protein